ncbi:MAG: SCP2 sterol-binding domain-containing protein [Gemmatirosa sp.]
MHRPFTQPWADAFRDAINADADYRAAASGWTWPVALLLDPPEPALGYPEPVAVQVALDRGTAGEARMLPGSAADADIVLGADYATWKQVVRGGLDPVGAVVSGRIRLVRGSLMTLMMHVNAAKALVACAAQVPTAFPDEG